MPGVPMIIPRAYLFTKRTHKTQDRIIFMALWFIMGMDTNQNHQKEKVHRVSPRENWVQASKNCFPWNHTGMLNSFSNWKLWQNTWIFPPGKLTRDCPNCIGGLKYRHYLPGTCQNSRLPKGKQVLRISHIRYSVQLLSFRDSFISV